MMYRASRLEEWCVALGHDPEKDGPVGVFKTKSPGSRCLFSAIWITSTGLVRPDHLLPTEKLSDLQLRYELEDYNSQGDWLSAQGLMALLSKQEGWRAIGLRAVIGARARLHDEFGAWWDPPSKERQVYPSKSRPGWSKPVDPVDIPPPPEQVPVVESPPARPAKPMHPGVFKGKDVTARQLNAYDKRLQQYELELEDWAIKLEAFNKKMRKKK